jgi:hypothetical protein
MCWEEKEEGCVEKDKTGGGETKAVAVNTQRRIRNTSRW